MRKPCFLALVLLLAASLLLLSVGQSHALSTQCWNCHTMHNSQGNLPMAFDKWGGVADATPNATLLRSTCAGCHTASNSDGLYNAAGISYIPIVYSTTGYPAKALAGGNFHDVGTGSLNKGHNCVDVTTTTDIAPPGFVTATHPTAYPGTGVWGPQSGWTVGTQVTCAGVYGCHGDRGTGMEDPLTALKGAHHGNATLASNQVCDGTTLAKSYRFLAGIKGVEQNNGNQDSWEYNATGTKHNAYYGVTDRTSPELKATISFLCAECHGNFHSTGAAGIGTASPWLRHPTDIAMPAGTTEFNDYGTTYIPAVPLGYIAPISTDTNGIPADRVVLCLSCHRAHGSQYEDLLRWEYGGTAAQSSLPSCRTCHTKK